MLKTRLIPAAAGAYQYPLLIKSLMLSGRRYEKSHEIVYRDQVRYSYATFNERVARLANVLSEAGVKAGDTVAVMDWDSHRYLECMFAIPMIGAVLHTINIRLSPEQILYTMNHAEDRFVLVNSEFVPLYQAVAGQLATVERTILLTDGAEKSAELPGLVGEYESLLAAASPRYDFPDFDENSIATTFYTTGTTGNPKGVYFSHRQLVLHTLAMASTIGSLDSIRLLGTSDVYMPITPMFHVHAWGTPYVATMLGVKQVYPGRYDPELLAGSEDERTTYRIKAGVPVPLVDAAIMDEQGRFLPADGESQGELVLRSPWLTQGYFREPERGEELWRGGWMHTGDVATLDGMGFIEIRDRIKDVIKTGGEWLSSLELEDLISRHPAVREVAVVGVPDPQWGERPFALLVVREGQQLDARGLKEHLKPFVEQGNINKWAIPSQIAVVTDIPKTSVGKLDKKRIRIEIAQWQEAGSAFLSTV
ncbi:fatty acid--CoA ligase [Pseudomonas aeruginosa]|uniref:fatty acid--CoA ligase n=1 Tax=Pseudomonas aeruginosa TaxID=287 RepID=UPI0015E7C609|nr:fatty acid--CoA ligase [Pseudomonas aeruginosa]